MKNKKGIVNIRVVAKKSLGFTLPHDLVKFSNFESGIYTYLASINKEGTVIIEFKLLEKTGD